MIEMPFDLINPAGLEPPIGYSHIAKIAGGTVVHVAGQAPFDVYNPDCMMKFRLLR
jgi:enamine deaminase RidA (YjgF/YER057c/UK114 family)